MIYDVQKRASAIPPTSAISSNGGWGGDFPAGSGWGKSFIETGHNRTPPAAAGVTPHPWKVELITDENNNNTTANITEGYIYDELLSLTQLPYDKSTLTGLPVVVGDVICIKYTTSSESVEIEKLSASGFEAWEFDSSDPPQVTFTRYPLAKIIQAEVGAGEDPRLDVEQMSASNLARVTICINGYVAYSFTPL
jgi:hypothetical protein